MAIDFAVLKTEINTDPTSRGYSPHVTSGATNVIADLLNEVLSTIAIQRAFLGANEVFEATDLAEFKALTLQERQMYNIIIDLDSGGSGGIPVGPGTNARATLAALFPPGSTTRSNLVALVMRKGSRAEELFGVNVSVTSGDVARSLRS